MFPHLGERIVVADKDAELKGGNIKDNVAVINAVDKAPILEKAEIKQLKLPTTTSEGGEEAVEVKVVTVAQLPTTKAIDNMIQNGQVSTPLAILVLSY